MTLVYKWSYLQDYSAPHQVEHSKDDIFVVILPVKQVVRHSDESHGYKGKGKVFQEAKIEGLTFTIVMSDCICG